METIWLEENKLEEFRRCLQERENAPATISKYIRDVRTFYQYAGEDKSVEKERLLKYKEWLMERYAVSSVNSMLAALNQFFSFLGLENWKLKRVRVQRQDLRGAGKELGEEEFHRLVQHARAGKKEQLALIMETICATGIRVSELKFFRAETIAAGTLEVWNKGKYRLVIIPKPLKKKLRRYIKERNIRSGPIFRTRTGKAKDRSNIWKEMKQLAKDAGIDLKKVFPHNLRHLFARVFYQTTKNLINLADILGHSNLEVTRIYASEGIKEWKRDLEKIRLIKKIAT